MAYRFPPDIEEQIRQRLAGGQYESEEELLRDALRALAGEDQEVAAINESIEGLEEGDEGIPLAEAFGRIRQKYDIPSDA